MLLEVIRCGNEKLNQEGIRSSHFGMVAIAFLCTGS